MTDAAFQRVLDRYTKRIGEEREKWKTVAPEQMNARRDEFLLEVGEDVGRFLADLAVGLKAKVIVELGTSYGYSTLFLASAARKTGGKVFTYDVAAEKQAYAKAQLAEAGLDGFVEFRLGDATKLLKDQPGPIDVALIDLWKDLYVPCFDLIHPKLSPTGVVAADNMTNPPAYRELAQTYRSAVRAKGDMEGVLLHIGNGLDVSSKTRM